MFHGKKCTKKCKNSISILRRQEQAAKLKTCKCDGLEDYDCKRIQQNMAKLCSDDKEHHTVPPDNDEENTILKETERKSEASTFSVSGLVLVGVLLAAIT